MSRTWTHPRLGTLEHDDIWWRREVVIPSLDTFTYIDAAVRDYRSTREPFELVLQCDSETEQPTEEMAALAATILATESGIMQKAMEAIWSDLNGQGPDSGMWWHGDLPCAYRGGNWASAVHESLTSWKLHVPKCPDDLKKVLEPKDLTVRREFSQPKPWIGELNFHAGFDVEHGVGVLTDGIDVLGIGYSSTARRFKR